MDLLEKTQSLLMGMDDMNMIDVSGNAVSTMDFENFDLDGLLASISSENSCDRNLKYSHEDKTCQEGMASVEVDSSSLDDQLKDYIEAHLKPNSAMNSLIDKSFCFDEWSGEVSSFDMLDPPLVSGIIAQEVEEENSFSKILEPVDMSEEFLNFTSMDDLCQWFGPSPEDSMCRTTIQMENTTTSTLSESIEFNPTFSDIVGSSSLSDIPMTSLTSNNAENDILDNMEFDLGFDQGDEWLGNLLAPVVSAATDTGFSECVSELTTGTSTKKRLFSELGIEDLLKGETNYNPFNSSSFVNELSTNNKGNVVEFSPMYRTPLHLGNLAGAETRANLMQPVSDLHNSKGLLGKKDTFSKLQVGMLNNDRHSINVKKVAQKPEEPTTQPTKKKARPGESTRPRPKDRQQIQDCLKELRGIIPNGGKVMKL